MKIRSAFAFKAKSMFYFLDWLISCNAIVSNPKLEMTWIRLWPCSFFTVSYVLQGVRADDNGVENNLLVVE